MNPSSLRRQLRLAVILLVGLPAYAAVPADEVRAVSASLQVSPAEAQAGDEVELQLRFTVRDPWYVYGQFPGDGGQQPMGMRLMLPEGVQAVGGWMWPPMSAVLSAGEHVLKHKLRIAALSDRAQIRLMLTYQACNAQLCLPMEMVELSVELQKPAAQDAESAADRAFKAIEQATPFTNEDSAAKEAYRALSYPEQLRYMDHQNRKLFALGEAFVNTYPDDERVFNVLSLCFTYYAPLFIDHGQPVTDEQVALAKAMPAASSGEERRRRYAQLMQRIPLDQAYETEWLRRGNAMVASVAGSPEVSAASKEKAEFMLLVRRIQRAHRIAQYDSVDWQSLVVQLVEHLNTHAAMDLMGARATDFLSGVRQQSPEAAAAGWKFLLANGPRASSPAGKAIAAAARAQLESIAIAAENRQFEALKFTALDGRAIDLAGLRGKVVLIDFWAMWCKPCVEEMPAIKALYDAYRGQGLEIIGVSGDSGTAQQLTAFLERGGYDWPQHYDGKGTANYFAQLFAVESWPTTYLLDRDGKPVGKNLRGRELEAAIKQLLAE